MVLTIQTPRNGLSGPKPTDQAKTANPHQNADHLQGFQMRDNEPIEFGHGQRVLRSW